MTAYTQKLLLSLLAIDLIFFAFLVALWYTMYLIAKYMQTDYVAYARDKCFLIQCLKLSFKIVSVIAVVLNIGTIGIMIIHKLTCTI